MTSRIRWVGEFCWFNLMTPETPAAREFFARLFGWTYRDMPGGIGHVAMVAGEQVGAIFDVISEQTPNGMPAGIGLMVRVASADDTAARARSLGGTSNDPWDVGPAGRMAELTDPAGTKLDIWEPKANRGMTADPSEHGTPSWFEALTNDAARQREFYGQLFGWKIEGVPMDGGEYTVFSYESGPPLAGLMELRPEWGPMPPHWRVYFTVDDADATTRLAQSLGGSVVEPPADIPGIGRYATLKSPQGVSFSVLTYAEAD